MHTVKCSAEFRSEGDRLTADRSLTDFITNLPADAALAPITVEKGSQRDPWPVMVGLRATWEEER